MCRHGPISGRGGHWPTGLVRKEYALALKLKKNIVPVKHEDFVFPEKNRVPTDVQAVVGMNAIPWISAYREASFERLKNALMM